MNKGFTLIETLAALAVVLLAVLSNARILVAALAQNRGSVQRFRLLEKLDYYKNYLSSLPLDAADLAAGSHGRREGDMRIDWRVEDASAALKRVRLRATAGGRALPLLLYRSRFLLAVRP